MLATRYEFTTYIYRVYNLLNENNIAYKYVILLVYNILSMSLSFSFRRH